MDLIPMPPKKCNFNAKSMISSFKRVLLVVSQMFYKCFTNVSPRVNWMQIVQMKISNLKYFRTLHHISLEFAFKYYLCRLARKFIAKQFGEKITVV
jgi:hypothetical protein